MNSKPRYVLRSPSNERNFYNINDMEPEELRVSSLRRPRIYTEEYRRPESRYSDRDQTPQPKNRICCSAPCIIGLIIGLTIGLLIAAAVAIPLGLIKRPTPPFVKGETSSTPNWVGTFQMDSTCDSSTCCCFTNQIKLTATSSNLLQLNGTLSGRCVGPSNLISYALSMPTDFAVGFTWYGQAIRVILSQDNSYLALIDNKVGLGYCSGTALRTSYNMSRMNSVNLSLMIFMFLMVIGIII